MLVGEMPASIANGFRTTVFQDGELMKKSPLEVVQALFSDPTNPDVVNALVAHDATYVALNFDNPELKKLMPWAGTDKGPGAIINTYLSVNRFWKDEKIEIQETLESDEKAALFGKITLTSRATGKTVSSPFSVLAKVKDGQIFYMQFMEDTFGTTGTLRSGGAAVYHPDPAGGEVTL